MLMSDRQAEAPAGTARAGSPPRTATLLTLATLLLLGSVPLRATAQDEASAPAQEGDPGGFREGRTGEIPEGTFAMMTPLAERAVADGLEWLATRQHPDGSFGSGAYRGNIAVTSLAGLAFMAEGSTPGRGRYGENVSKALRYILDHTATSGFISVNNASTHGPMYSHGFGTLFLAEAYGMTGAPDIRDKLKKAVELIESTQNEEGGWRYQPRPDDADISVTICQINALRAARNAGISIRNDVVERCIDYVRKAQNPDGGFRYQLRQRDSAFPRSAAGVVALQSAAIYSGEEIDKGIGYLMNYLRSMQRGRGVDTSHFFYGHYYAVQALWIRGGDEWTAWYPEVRDKLLQMRRSQGHWEDNICDEYGTAMALIILQVPNNLLPIFQR